MRLLRKAVLTFGFIFVLGFLATEGAIFSMAWSYVRSYTAHPDAEMFDKYRTHHLRKGANFSLLAAGDIAACYHDGTTGRLLRNIEYTLGVDRGDAGANQGLVSTTSLIDAFGDHDVLALGDLAYKRGEPVSFIDCYDPYWGRAKDRTWPVPGNHEYQSLGAYGYFDYWGERAGPDRKGYYAIQSGDWLLLALNSEVDAAMGSDQAEWIDRILPANHGLCVGAFFHRPAFSSQTRNGTENANKLFARMVEAEAVFVLNGHNHFFERTYPLDDMGNLDMDGTPILVAGAGGRTSTSAPPISSMTAELISGKPGLLKLDFSPDGMRWSYLVAGKEKPLSTGTIDCRKS